MITMTSALKRAVNLFGHRPAVVDTERNFTWTEHMERVAKGADALQKLGVGKGDRFGIIAANQFRYMEMLHAGYWAGAIPVPINHRLAPPEILHILEDADCKLLALGDGFLSHQDAKVLAPWRDKILYLGADSPDGDFARYEDVLAKASPAEPHDPEEEDLALLLYTGGTTGRSKGVQLSHKNIVSNGLQVAIAMKAQKEDVFLRIAPMFHAVDLLITGFTITGSACSFLPEFSGAAALKAIQDYKITTTMFAPTMIIMMLQEPDIQDYDLSSFRLLFYGSSPMAAEWVKKTIETFEGVEIQQGYGLTETSPILTILEPDDHAMAIETGQTGILRAAGRPVTGIEMKILNNDGNEMPVNEAGEVVVRGPNVTQGYLNRPDENEKAFNNGWFHTGDVGRIDENGVMYLMDRKKDMIVSGGENIYTSEVEAALYQHPDVHECAVVGVPDEQYGESLFAVIVPAPRKSLTDDDIMEHCKGLIGGYKIPRKMDFIEEMPKSAMGKILKTELRKIYGKG